MFIVTEYAALIGPVVSEKIFENDDGQTDAAGVTDILLAHP